MRRIVMALALLAVASPAPLRADDQQVANQIASNLKSSGQLRGYNIKVSFHQGIARLDGYVQNEEQLDQALTIVNGSPAVESVVNRLSVQNAAQPQVVQAAAQQQQPVLARSRPQPQPQQGQPQRAAAPQPQYAIQPQMMQQQPYVGMRQQVQPYPVAYMQPGGGQPQQMMPVPTHVPVNGAFPAVYDQPSMPPYAWPSYAAHPNYAALTYPKQYSPTAWPYIGPFYPYPQVPLGWRKVTLEWDDGWWFLDFTADRRHVGGK
jgi:hypothetical protein